MAHWQPDRRGSSERTLRTLVQGGGDVVEIGLVEERRLWMLVVWAKEMQTGAQWLN